MKTALTKKNEILNAALEPFARVYTDNTGPLSVSEMSFLSPTVQFAGSYFGYQSSNRTSMPVPSNPF
jgi:hypothetical protein